MLKLSRTLFKVAFAPNFLNVTKLVLANNFATIKKYTEQHEWVKFDDASNIASVGITDYAQSELGDLVFLDLFEKGKKVNAGESVGEIESVKIAASIYSPVNGEIVDNNKDAIKDPQLVNKKAEETWLVKLTLNDKSELNKLMEKNKYDEFVKKIKEDKDKQ